MRPAGNAGLGEMSSQARPQQDKAADDRRQMSHASPSRSVPQSSFAPGPSQQSEFNAEPDFTGSLSDQQQDFSLRGGDDLTQVHGLQSYLLIAASRLSFYAISLCDQVKFL